MIELNKQTVILVGIVLVFIILGSIVIDLCRSVGDLQQNAIMDGNVIVFKKYDSEVYIYNKPLSQVNK